MILRKRNPAQTGQSGTALTLGCLSLSLFMASAAQAAEPAWICHQDAGSALWICQDSGTAKVPAKPRDPAEQPRQETSADAVQTTPAPVAAETVDEITPVPEDEPTDETGTLTAVGEVPDDLPGPVVPENLPALTADVPETPLEAPDPELGVRFLINDADWQNRRFPAFSQCPGPYLPGRVGPLPLANAEAPLDMKADSAPLRTATRTHLKGNVQIEQGSERFAADEVFLNHETTQVDASGGILYEDGALVLAGDSLTGNRDAEITTINQVRYRIVPTNANGSADRVVMQGRNLVTLDNSSFTTCPSDDNAWAINASEILLDREDGTGEAWNMTLRVKDVPVMYLPYISFPIDDRRRSGFLYPAFSENKRNGIDIATPYYLNLAPNYDLTLTPRWLKKRGTQLGAQFRYLTSGSRGIIGAEYLPDDREADFEDNPDRWSWDVYHHTRFSPRWTAGINAQGVSDNDYFHDLGTDFDVGNKDRLLRHGYIQYRDPHWSFNARLRQEQVLSGGERYRELPSFRLSGNYPDQWAGMNFFVSSELTRFDKKSDTAVTGDRFSVAPGISMPYETLSGFVVPTLRYHHTQYKLDDPVTDESETINRGLPIFSLDSGLFFERELVFGEEDFTQTLEPRLFYLYVPYEDQDDIPRFDTNQSTFNFSRLFRTNRFNGMDRIGDANQVSASLTSRFLDSVGRERLRLTAGEIFYFRDRQVTLTPSRAEGTAPNSALLAEAVYNWTSGLSVRSGIEWDHHNDETNRGVLSLHYEPEPNKIINLSHRVRRRSSGISEESDVSVAWPLVGNWNLVGRWNNDLVEHRTIESLIGLEYESCCWAVRVVGRRYLNARLDGNGFIVADDDDEFNSGIFFQFIFKGLGGTSTATTTLLRESIFGYEDLLGQ